MTIEVVVDEAIAASPEAVYARIADIERWPSWLIASGIIRVERSTTGAVAAGERLVVEQRAAGRAGTFEAEVTAATAPGRFSIAGRDGEGVSIEIDAAIAPTDAGSALHWSIRIGLPFRYRVFESMARPQVQRAAMLDILALRIGLEAPPTD